MSSFPSLEEIHHSIVVYAPGLAKLVETPYEYIFPEYPFAGVLVFLFAMIMFLIYMFKAGLEVAFKMAIFIIVSMSLILLALHWLNRPLHLLAT